MSKSDMQTKSVPLVSIGIPVFNGANYIRQAIDSILEQTYPNLEIIISDNASTDQTAEICNGYLNNDLRIRYYRNEKNIGAGANYDSCFNLSCGKYFKWSAHDDMIESTYIEKAVSLLEQNNEAVLCISQVRQVDENSNTIRVYDLNYPGLSSTRPSQRFRPMLMDMTGCEYFFGLFRRDSLIGSELHGNFINSDKILIAEMALRGNFIKIDEPLFLHREHVERYTKAVYPDRIKASKWFDPGHNRRIYRRLTLYKKYLHIINKNIRSLKERLLCCGYLLQYAFRKRNLKILSYDLIMAISPGLYYQLNIPSADRRIR
jgi:glycosyltransferase involved in cell wall biosynthesis